MTQTRPGFEALQQAAFWYAETMEPGGNISGLQRWLEEDAEHRQAWEYVQRVSQRFDPLRDSEHPAAVASVLTRPSTLRLSRRRLLGAAVVIPASTWLIWAGYPWRPLQRHFLAATADHHTATGELRQCQLPDGGSLWLDTQTAVNVNYTVSQRRVTLLTGQILIETSRDSQRRPFIVETPHGALRAIGTRFSVCTDDDETLLKVYRGAVEVTQAQRTEPVRVPAGEKIRFQAQGLLQPSSFEADSATWSQGILLANNMPLGELVETLARYRRGYLGCSPDIAGLSVVGAFPLRDTDQALAMLVNALPIVVKRHFSWWVTLEAKA